MQVYSLKLVKKSRRSGGSDSNQSEQIEMHPCIRYTVTPIPEDCYAAKEKMREPGIYIDMVGPNHSIQLPRDGDVVYVITNSSGTTIETYRWPISLPKKELRTA